MSKSTAASVLSFMSTTVQTADSFFIAQPFEPKLLFTSSHHLHLKEKLPFMQTLHIHFCRRPPISSHSSLDSQPMDHDAVCRHIAPTAELTGVPLARLVRRLRAGCPVTFPVRAQVDPQPLASLFSAAGAEVTVSSQVTTPATLVA